MQNTRKQQQTARNWNGFNANSVKEITRLHTSFPPLQIFSCLQKHLNVAGVYLHFWQTVILRSPRATLICWSVEELLTSDASDAPGHALLRAARPLPQQTQNNSRLPALIKHEDNLHYMRWKYCFIQARKGNSIDWPWTKCGLLFCDTFWFSWTLQTHA